MNPTAADQAQAWPQAENIQGIRESFAAIQLSDAEAGMAFYNRLFAIAPAVRPMFPPSMEGQSEKLFKTLRILVASLDRLDSIVPVLRDLGRRHIAYGAKPEHYAVVGSALIGTLRDALGDAFTPAVEQDWLRLFSIVSDTMLRGAAESN